MPERPPTIFEINDDDAPIHAERPVQPATNAERAARAKEVYVDPGFARERAVSLGDARDAVMAAYENAQTEGEPAPKETALPIETRPPIALKDVITQDDGENPAVQAAEALIREIQQAKHPSEQSRETASSQEEESGPGILERVHDRVEHARSVLGDVERKITSTLGQAENVLHKVEGYLDEFQDKNRVQAKILGMDDKVREIRFLVGKTANIIGKTHEAISTGAQALDAPLRLLEEVTDRADEDAETQSLATQSARELRDLQASPTSLSHEDLRGIDGNLSELQRPRMSREEKLQLVRNTLQIIRAYNQSRREAERPDSPKKSKLQHIARGLEAYIAARR